MSYVKLKAKIDSLKNWDPQLAYINKSGKLTNKTKGSCWQRIFSCFSGDSHAKETAIALEAIYKEAKTNVSKLHSDKQTAADLKQLAISLYSSLVDGKDGGKVKNKRARRDIASTCRKINCLSKIALCAPSSSANDYSALSVFLKDVNVKELSLLQSQNYLIILKRYLKSIQPPLNKKNAKQCQIANKILLFARQVKEQHLKNNTELSNEQTKLHKHYLDLQSLILHQIFAKTISYQALELAKLFENYKHQKPNGEVINFLNACAAKHNKGKPYSLPAWYHCTKPEAVSSIAQSQIILYSTKIFPGAFVSSQPEISYGPYIFCFSRHINRFAFSNNKLHPPLVTYLNTNESDPIHIGKKSPAFKKSFHSFFSRSIIWAGFKQSIFFERPVKAKNPLGYYNETGLSLVGYQNNGKLQKKHLGQLFPRKVQIMELNDLWQLYHLIGRTVPLHLPKKWSTISFNGKLLVLDSNVASNYSAAS